MQRTANPRIPVRFRFAPPIAWASPLTTHIPFDCDRPADAWRRWLLRVLLMLMLAASVAANASEAAAEAQNWPLPAGMVERALSFDSGERRFLEFQPAKLRPGAAVLIVLHGGGQSARKMFRRKASPHQEWPVLAEREGFLLLAPNGTNPRDGDPAGANQHWFDLRNSWPPSNGPPDDVGFIAALAEWAVRERVADPKRIYVAGASNGGMMTFRLLIERPELFAAGVSFIATLPAWDLLRPQAARPILIAPGTADPVVKWEGGDLLKSGVMLRSAPETLAYWLDVHGLQGEKPLTAPRVIDIDPGDDCRTEITSWGGTADAPAVQFWAVHGSGHWIPTTDPYRVSERHLQTLGPRCLDVDGPELAWDFLKGQCLP